MLDCTTANLYSRLDYFGNSGAVLSVTCALRQKKKLGVEHDKIQHGGICWCLLVGMTSFAFRVKKGVWGECIIAVFKVVVKGEHFQGELRHMMEYLRDSTLIK